MKANRKEDSVQTTFASAERDARILQQRARLTGLRFKGGEECGYGCYDVTLTMLEKDSLIYLGPEKFLTRRHELLQRTPAKEIAVEQTTAHHSRERIRADMLHHNRARCGECPEAQGLVI